MKIPSAVDDLDPESRAIWDRISNRRKDEDTTYAEKLLASDAAEEEEKARKARVEQEYIAMQKDVQVKVETPEITDEEAEIRGRFGITKPIRNVTFFDGEGEETTDPSQFYEKYPEYFRDQNIQLAEGEFKNEIKTLVGPLASGNAVLNTTPIHSTPSFFTREEEQEELNGKQTLRGGFYKPDMPEFIKPYLGRRSDMPIVNQNVRGTVPSREALPGDVTYTQNQKRPNDIISHEVSHAISDQIDDFTTNMSPAEAADSVVVDNEEYGNRIWDLYRARTQEGWYSSLQAFRDIYGRYGRVESWSRWEDRALREVKRHSDGMFEQEWKHGRYYFSNKKDKAWNKEMRQSHLQWKRVLKQRKEKAAARNKK
jgi:hypothetical protein